MYKNASRAVVRTHWGTTSARLKIPRRDEEDFKCYSDRRSQHRYSVQEALRRAGLDGKVSEWSVQLFHSAYARLFFVPNPDMAALLKRICILPKGKRMEHSSIYPGLCRFDCQGYNVGVFLQPEVETVEVFRISPLKE
jgi:hypothetical protein